MRYEATVDNEKDKDLLLAPLFALRSRASDLPPHILLLGLVKS